MQGFWAGSICQRPLFVRSSETRARQQIRSGEEDICLKRFTGIFQFDAELMK